MDRRRAAGHRRARRHRSHHPRASFARRAAVAAAGAERLLGRQCSLARRVGATPRHRQRLCPARRTGSRSGSGCRCRPRAARLGGNATRHGRRRDQAAGLDLVADGSGIPAEVIVPQAYHVPTRRELLLGSTALVAAAFVPGTVRAEGRDPRLLTIVLRGAVDGLAVVAPVGDPNWTKLRGDKALALDGAAPALPLDGFFALNPAMPHLHRLYHAGQATIVHAVATPYRERSHFDGQDVLESGLPKPGTADTGWLNRALAAVEPGGRIDMRGRQAFAVGPITPLVVRGPAPVLSWVPPRQRARRPSSSPARRVRGSARSPLTVGTPMSTKARSKAGSPTCSARSTVP